MTTKQTCKAALLISGEPGTGKSRWIREQASFAKAKLFRWNARTDRSLREGREVLHQQVRCKERLYVWIEGADDLTQEAQAFLRRILETAAPNVTCALEVRELWKLSPPIISRCNVIMMRAEHSYRANRNLTLASHMGLTAPKHTGALPAWNSIISFRKAGEDPYEIIEQLISVYGAHNLRIQECIRAIGAGSSPWIQLSEFLLNAPPRPISNS
jgi:hypothetical protein